MPKIHSKLSEIEFKDERLVESIERIVTAIELQEALQRLLNKERDITEKLEAENTELKNKNDKLKALIKQQQIEVIRIFEKSN
jgi:hypothetical protein